jgi:hypothetical protein
MEASIASFVERGSEMGIDLGGEGADVGTVMKKFGEADVNDRTKMIADMHEQKKLKNKLKRKKN